MEEAGIILRDALVTEANAAPDPNLVDALHAIFTLLGGFDLDLPPRGSVRVPPDFAK